MKLRLTLALLLGLSIACGSDEAETVQTLEQDENTEATPPPPPPPPPPPENDTPDVEAGGDEGTDEGEGTDEVEEDKYESKSFTVTITAERRSQMRPNAETELTRISREAGYGEIRTVKLTAINCSDSGCTAQASGKASRKVEKEAAEDAEK